MSWYIHPSKQLRDDELPPELVLTSRDGSIKQAYVPYNANERLQAENASLKAQVEALKDYAHALELCKGEAYLCEYCTFNGIDFEHDDIHCTIDFDGLRKKAGMDS